jgi:hypothetical protein
MGLNVSAGLLALLLAFGGETAFAARRHLAGSTDDNGEVIHALESSLQAVFEPPTTRRLRVENAWVMCKGFTAAAQTGMQLAATRERCCDLPCVTHHLASASRSSAERQWPSSVHDYSHDDDVRCEGGGAKRGLQHAGCCSG